MRRQRRWFRQQSACSAIRRVCICIPDLEKSQVLWHEPAIAVLVRLWQGDCWSLQVSQSSQFASIQFENRSCVHKYGGGSTEEAIWIDLSPPQTFSFIPVQLYTLRHTHTKVWKIMKCGFLHWLHAHELARVTWTTLPPVSHFFKARYLVETAALESESHLNISEIRLLSVPWDVYDEQTPHHPCPGQHNDVEPSERVRVSLIIPGPHHEKDRRRKTFAGGTACLQGQLGSHAAVGEHVPSGLFTLEIFYFLQKLSLSKSTVELALLLWLQRHKWTGKLPVLHACSVGTASHGSRDMAEFENGFKYISCTILSEGFWHRRYLDEILQLLAYICI